MDVDLGLSDLNIPVECGHGTSLKKIVTRALELGYQTIALNTVVHQVYKSKLFLHTIFYWTRFLLILNKRYKVSKYVLLILVQQMCISI